MPDTRAPEDPSISEHSRLLLAMHSAMRADGRRLTIATDIVADDPQSARELGRAVTELVTLIHDHHCTEDDVLYPFLVERWPGFVHDATQLEGDHIDLDAAMIHVTAGLRLLARPATARIRHDTRRRLVDDAHAFNRLLLGHLDREEAVILPAFEATISPADQRAVTKAESKLSTYRHVRMAVPWVLANTTAAEATALRRLAPRLVGVIHDRHWERRFRRIMAPLYAAAPVPNTPGNRSAAAAAA